MPTKVARTRVAYGRVLSAAWREHLAPRAANAPTVVSTFAGGGGSSLGYGMAGFRELLAVEWDDHAAACFRRNFPDVPLFHGDIAQLDPAALPLAPGELDVFDGSPPCQGFSLMGKRQIDDPRNQLFREYVRLLSAWQPKVFVMENVAGMVQGPMLALFAEILDALKTAGPGYRVRARLLNAAFLGVPQRRKRIIFVGVRSDLPGEPVHPRPVSREITVREALHDLPGPGRFERPRGKIAALTPLIPPGRHGGNALTSLGGKGNFFSLMRLHWDRPANTITKEFAPGRSGILHPDEERFLGLAELARLQSFPAEYDWGEGTVKAVWARIGNSVPPLMMREIARTVRRQLLDPLGEAVAAGG